MSAPLQTQVLERLAEVGTWVPREALDALTACRVALDDVLADLVVAERIEHQRFVGYRLALGPLAREALQKLKLEPQLRRAVHGKTIEKRGKSQVRLGVAERCAALGGRVVTYEMALPVCESPAAALAQAQAWMSFCSQGGLVHG